MPYLIGGEVVVNDLYFWKNRIEKDIQGEVEVDSCIAHFSIVNQGTSYIFDKWFSLSSQKELLDFLEYVVLPSGYYSRLFGKATGEVYLEAESYENAIYALENNKLKRDEELISNFKHDYQLLEEIRRGDFDFKKLENFCKSYNDNLAYKDIVFATIEVFENIREVGLRTIKEYEEEGMLLELEELMGMKKKEIKEMFLSVEYNPFMKRKIIEFLDNTFDI